MVGFPVTVEIPVLWGDMDALRHVNNARFFTPSECTRLEYKLSRKDLPWP